MPISRNVVGFLFSREAGKPPRVLLLRYRPRRGEDSRLIGIGGPVEAEETPLDGMRRLFAEKTGLSGLHWCLDDERGGKGWQARFYSAAVPPEVYDAAKAQRAREPLVSVYVNEVAHRPDVFPFARIQIPLAVNSHGIANAVVRATKIPAALNCLGNIGSTVRTTKTTSHLRLIAGGLAA